MRHSVGWQHYKFCAAKPRAGERQRSAGGTGSDSRGCRKQGKSSQTHAGRPRGGAQAIRISLRDVSWEGWRREGRTGSRDEIGAPRLARREKHCEYDGWRTVLRRDQRKRENAWRRGRRSEGGGPVEPRKSGPFICEKNYRPTRQLEISPGLPQRDARVTYLVEQVIGSELPCSGLGQPLGGFVDEEESQHGAPRDGETS